MSETQQRMPLSTQLTRFVLTGGLSAIVDYGLLVLGMEAGLGHDPAKATVVGPLGPRLTPPGSFLARWLRTGWTRRR